MITKENLTYAIRNLMNRKVRSFLTILSILVGITTIFIFVSFGMGLYFYMDEISVDIGVDKLFVQAKGVGAPGLDSTFKLTDDDLDTLGKTRGIVQTTGMAFAIAMVQKDSKIMYNYLAGMPTDNSEDLDFILEFLTVDILDGRQLRDSDRGKVMLGYNYAVPNRLFEKPFKVGDKIEINDEEFKIIGFYEEIGNPSDDANVYLTMDEFNRLTDADETNYGMLVARVDNVDNIDEIAERAKKKLRKSRGLEEGKEDFFIASFEDYIEAFGAAMDFVIGFILVIAIVSVVVSAINTANTMFTSILERTKEIGVLKAIGAKNSEILVIFLLESSILGFIAGVFGVLLGWLISLLGGNLLAMLGWSFLSPRFPLALFAACILFATLVGTISGTVPAYNASKKNPVDSLRYE